MKGTQRALRALQEKESAKARLLQNPLIADTARARRLLEGHEEKLAESAVSICFAGGVAYLVRQA